MLESFPEMKLICRIFGKLIGEYGSGISSLLQAAKRKTKTKNIAGTIRHPEKIFDKDGFDMYLIMCSIYN